MRTAFHSIPTLFFLLAISVSMPTLYGQSKVPTERPRMSPATAIASLRAHLLKDATYANNLRKGCVVFLPDASNAAFIFISVFEDHTKGCGGDPFIAHHLDDFRVYMNGTIEWYCVYDAVWVPYKVYESTNGLNCNQQSNAP